MPYTYHTDEERREMLDALGLKSEDELFTQIPEALRLDEPLAIGAGLTEYDTVRHFQEMAGRNSPAVSMTSFLGGGMYDHIVPSVIKHLAGRSEFYTAYTPYQAEVSQGTLQVIFEYQSLISRLTGLPVANASMYDGATAFAESALMAAKVTRRNRFIYSTNINPRFVGVLKTYATAQDLELTSIPYSGSGDLDEDALLKELGDDVAAVLIQTPNYFGVLEAPWKIREAITDAGALLVTAVDPCSLSIFQSPGDYGADIAVGEGQVLGNDMSFGGPLLGFMACGQKFVRSLPGRLVSETTDVDGKRAFTLTLQTREQHIRREKATSNICTNQGLLALKSTIYMAILGETGFHELGKICHARAHELASMIEACPGYLLPFDAPYFREFVVRCPVDAATVVAEARKAGILAGIPVSKFYGEGAKSDLLVAVTEKRTTADFEAFCQILKNVS